ncbi:MAG: UDP-N-acetylmuramoyl-L-alanine--D-glutamate ligase [Tepidisphaeraceae bacterium]
MHDVRNKRVTVAGLGRFGGGISVAKWLVAEGAKVLVTDRDPAEKLADSVKQLDGLPIEFRLGGHRHEDFSSPDLVVTSPAIPPTNEFLQTARKAGIPITTEIVLFVERCPAEQVLGVTGTKGKSTTSAMLGQMLQTKHTTWFGGNIGRSLLSDLPKIARRDLVLLELSSFMLHYLGELKWSPHVGVITMLSADHLDWHGSADAYLADKANLIRFQKSSDFAVLNDENEPSRALRRDAKAKIVPFGLAGREPFELLIPGRHNQLNAQAAFAAAGVMGVMRQQAQAVLREFKGLPHRLQLVHEDARTGIRYFNDSIATIPEAAVAALESFPERTVVQIVGGHDKGLPIDAMCEALARRAKAVLCIGKTGPKVAEGVGRAGGQATQTAHECGDLAAAMTKARQIATRGDVVLLSTGYASYDQFTNFEQRGETFARLAREA